MHYNITQHPFFALSGVSIGSSRGASPDFAVSSNGTSANSVSGVMADPDFLTSLCAASSCFVAGSGCSVDFCSISAVTVWFTAVVSLPPGLCSDLSCSATWEAGFSSVLNGWAFSALVSCCVFCSSSLLLEEEEEEELLRLLS